MTDQTPLRDRVAETLARAEGWTWAHGVQFKDIDTSSADAYRRLADVVLAVLPEPADRAAVLREAAEAVARYTGNELDANAKMLHRMADETAAHPAEHAWSAELYDPVADEWMLGTPYASRDRAVNHLNKIGPTWEDGTPVQRRLVRATTTYTVEDTTAQDGGEQ